MKPKRALFGKLTLTLVLLASPALAENKLNIMTGEYEVVPPGYELRFNKMTGEWGYAPPGAQLELNRSTLEFEYPGTVRPRSSDPVPWEYRQWERDTQREMPSAPAYRSRERDDRNQRSLEETRRAVQSIHERQQRFLGR